MKKDVNITPTREKLDIWISYQVDFKARKVTQDKEDVMMIKGLINQEYSN